VKPGIGVAAWISAVSSRRLLEVAQQAVDLVDRVAQPEPDVGGHLVVARAAGVQALAGIADKRGEALLDVEMHILVIEIPVELAGLDLGCIVAMPCSIAARSSAPMMPWRASMRACASEARISCRHMRRSKKTEAV
jgi:hypothetical protein